MNPHLYIIFIYVVIEIIGVTTKVVTIAVGVEWMMVVVIEEVKATRAEITMAMGIIGSGRLLIVTNLLGLWL